MFKTKKSRFKPERISVTSGPSAARDILQKLMKQFVPVGLSPDDSGRIELVVAEAVNNIVEHAYPDGTPDGPIQLDWSIAEKSVSFSITDQGLGMPDGKAPEGRPQSVRVDIMDLPEGGFGWFLIRDQAHNVDYRRTAWENRLSFAIALNGQESDAD